MQFDRGFISPYFDTAKPRDIFVIQVVGSLMDPYSFLAITSYFKKIGSAVSDYRWFHAHGLERPEI